MEALELETISLLVALLKDSEAIVRAKAALAIETYLKLFYICIFFFVKDI